MSHLSPEAARIARLRRDFEQAMARGCSILDLRAARAGCSRRRERESLPEMPINGRQGFVIIDEDAGFDLSDVAEMPAQSDFLAWEAPWMGCD